MPRERSCLRSSTHVPGVEDYQDTITNARQFLWNPGELLEVTGDQDDGVIDVPRSHHQKVFQALLNAEEGPLMKYSSEVTGPDDLISTDSKGTWVRRVQQGSDGSGVYAKTHSLQAGPGERKAIYFLSLIHI